MSRPAVFLDRDGVIVVDVGYPHRDEDLALIRGAAAAIRRWNDQGRPVVVVTNQSGVARGLFTLERMEGFNALMIARLAEAGARIDAVYACPFHAEAVEDRWRHPDHPDRKPNPGMILKAAADLDLDLSRSVLIGDREADMEAARRAGVAGHLFPGGDLAAFASEL